MTTDQAFVLEKLRASDCPLLAREVAERVGRDQVAVQEDLRTLEDEGRVLGGEMGLYYVNSPVFRSRGRA
jgi:predicted transcriptional regulator